MGKMFVLDRSGHGLSIKWTVGNRREVAAAKATFADWKAKGYALFRMTDDGDQGERMQEFDEAAPGVLAVPPLAGG